MLRQLEALQSERIRQRVERRTAPAVAPPMSDAQQQAALDLLRDPKLIARIDRDFDTCGLVGEQANRRVCYLTCVARLLPRPLSVLIQSSSGTGKTTLQDAVLRLMPAEQTVRLSALTTQSLYYIGPGALRHKILAIAEEEGVAQAADMPRSSVRFTQRDVRQALAWNDRTMRRHLSRLVDLEYVLVHRTGRGNGRAYQLTFAASDELGEVGGVDASGASENESLLGLIDVRQLRRGKKAAQQG